MRTILLCVLLPFILLAGACGTNEPIAKSKPKAPALDARPTIVLDPVWISPDLSTPLGVVEVTGNAPNLGRSAPLFSIAGGFTFPNGTSPATVTFTDAPVFDQRTGASTVGTGTFQGIVIQGTTYGSNAALSISGVFQDHSTAVEYLVLSAFTEETDPSGTVIGTVVHVIVPSSDFAVGATVNFDGTDRLGLFARGDISQPDPELVAAAVSGSVTFTSGSLATNDLITASASGNFGEINYMPPPPPPPPTGATLSPGSYTLTHDPAPRVWCDGTLTGQEASFSGVTAASIGFTDGAVTVAAQGASNMTISGTPITSGYGAASLLLEPLPDAPPSVLGGFVNSAGSGPIGTDLVGTYLMFDASLTSGTDIAGGAGAGYMTSLQDGFCSVDFMVTLSP